MSREMYTLQESKCPYCDSVLDPTPKKKMQCKSCSNTFYVRTRASDRERVIVTEKGKSRIDAVNDVLSAGSIAREEFLAEKAETSGMSDNDIIWRLFNKKIMEDMKKADWQTMKMLYYEMALFLNREGKEFFHLLQESRKCELRSFKEADVKKVEVSAILDGGCKPCAEMDSKVFSVDEALEKMPIPVKDCENDIFDNGKGFCRCMYVPVFIRGNNPDKNLSFVESREYDKNGNLKVSIKLGGTGDKKTSKAVYFIWGIVVFAIILFLISKL